MFHGANFLKRYIHACLTPRYMNIGNHPGQRCMPICCEPQSPEAPLDWQVCLFLVMVMVRPSRRIEETWELMQFMS